MTVEELVDEIHAAWFDKIKTHSTIVIKKYRLQEWKNALLAVADHYGDREWGVAAFIKALALDPKRLEKAMEKHDESN